jgi:type IV pilus assembly protein PilA
MTGNRYRGFTYVEVLMVVAMAVVLATIGVPRFLQAQKNAKKSEAITQLKSLHAAMSTQALMPMSIHVPGFDPPRGNRYSYHVSEPCFSWEDRSMQYAVSNDTDTCIGADTYADPSLPSVFYGVPIAAVSWDMDATMNGMGTSPGFFGTETQWDYLAQAAGDVDGNPFDGADTWIVASADAQIANTCPMSGAAVPLAAGEPFQVYADTQCQ